MPRKVFTAGEVLAAADVNEFLMDQAVQSFATSAARGSAIPTPVIGMYTHLEDAPQRTEFWNGSAWVSPFGATLLNKTSYTSQTSVSVDNVFSSQYDSYKIFLSCLGTTAGDISIRLRASGSDLATSNYNTQIQQAQSTSLTGVRATGQTVIFSGVTRTSARSFVEITVNDPFQTSTTQFISSSTDALDGASGFQSFGYFTLTTSATGFKINTPTSTGEIQVFGFRNA
jgi:hypothetical protein